MVKGQYRTCPSKARPAVSHARHCDSLFSCGMLVQNNRGTSGLPVLLHMSLRRVRRHCPTHGLLASLAYQVLKHACGGLAICVAKLVIQGRHNFNEWLRLFRRCIRMRRSYLRTSSRLLTGSFYALMLIMFSSLGPTCAVVVAYATVWAICRLSLIHI